MLYKEQTGQVSDLCPLRNLVRFSNSCVENCQHFSGESFQYYFSFQYWEDYSPYINYREEVIFSSQSMPFSVLVISGTFTHVIIISNCI